MKLQGASARQGSGLIVAVIFTAIIGISMASYLSLVRTQNLSVARSLYWNTALPVAESGLEEAMAHLNQNGTNLQQQGWSLVNGRHLLARTNGIKTYTVTITTNTLGPTVTSTGLVNLAEMQRPTSWVKRVVQVTTTNTPLFSKSLVAKFQIDLKGNNMYSDSYDSLNTNYSTGGAYDPAKRRDNGDVATNSGLTNSLNVGNADIYGKVSTGPGGSVSIGPGGVVGTLSYITNGGTGIQPGRFTDDMNVNFPRIQSPVAAAPMPGSGDYGGTNYTYKVDSGSWQFNSLQLDGNNDMIITGEAVIFMKGNFRMTGTSRLIIAPGASLKVYGTGNFDLQGSGIFNYTGLPINNQFYGLDTSTSFALGGNGNFTGVVYAPNADFTTVGNGSIYGAVVAKSAALTGNGNFHYDEALGRIGPNRGYVPTTWAEL